MLFLKAILEPSEQDVFDHLTRGDAPALTPCRTGKGCPGLGGCWGMPV